MTRSLFRTTRMVLGDQSVDNADGRVPTPSRYAARVARAGNPDERRVVRVGPVTGARVSPNTLAGTTSDTPGLPLSQRLPAHDLPARRRGAADDPVAYAHGILVKSFLNERRLRRSGELPRRSSVPAAATSKCTSEKVRVPTGPIPSTTLPTYRR
jgi:hypothetical protein